MIDTKDILYLDIETTGLNYKLDQLTCVGILDDFGVLQYSPTYKDTTELQSRVKGKTIVTYNGSRFDLPWLEHHVPELKITNHIDLYPICSSYLHKPYMTKETAYFKLAFPHETLQRGGSGFACTVAAKLGRWHSIYAHNAADLYATHLLFTRMNELGWLDEPIPERD